MPQAETDEGQQFGMADFDQLVIELIPHKLEAMIGWRMPIALQLDISMHTSQAGQQ